MSGRRSAVAAWLPFTGWLGLIFVLSSIPELGPPDVGLPLSDKLAHLGEYGVLGALFGYARQRRTSPVRDVLAGALLGLSVGTLDEIYQRGTPGRESSPLDTVADTVGAALGVWFAQWFAARWARRTGAGKS